MAHEDAIDKRYSRTFEIEDVKELFIQGMTIRWDEEIPEKNQRSSLVLRDVTDFEIRSFSGRQGLVNGSSPAIQIISKELNGISSYT